MFTNCLLVINNDSPLNFAMEMLLVPSSGIKAVKSRARDLQSMINEIHVSQSQVVIIEETATLDNETSLADMHKLNPDLKIILVPRDGNYVHIFRQDEIAIQNASEFLDIIRSK